MRTVSINPYARKRAYERENQGRPRVATLAWAFFGVWCATLLVAAIGYRVELGSWPPFENGVMLSMAYGFFVLPLSAGAHFGPNIVGAAVALLFWPAVLGLHAAAFHHRQWRYLAAAALILAFAGWAWTIGAVTASSI